MPLHQSIITQAPIKRVKILDPEQIQSLPLKYYFRHATVASLKKDKQNNQDDIKDSINTLMDIKPIQNNLFHEISDHNINMQVDNPEKSSFQEKSKKCIEGAISFSDFPETVEYSKSKLAVSMLSIVKCKQNQMMVRAFLAIQAAVNQDEDLEPFFPFDDCQFNGLQASNPEHGFLPLQSKFSFRDRKRASSRISTKELIKKAFVLNKENNMLKEEVKRLQHDVNFIKERKTKEIMKKQGSLVGLMEELGDKNEQIEQLKSAIRTLDSQINVQGKGVHYMLEQDSQTLRRTILRLEHANDRLNLDVSKTKIEIKQLKDQAQEHEAKIEELQRECKKLKQNNFELETDRYQVSIMRKQASLASKRFSGKIEKVKKLQKRLSLVVKIPDLFPQEETESKADSLKGDNQSELTKAKTGAESSDEMKRAPEIAEEISANKLQAVINYLINITDEDYELQNDDLFQEEERELLDTHKQLFNKNRVMHCIERQNPGQLSSMFGHQLSELLNHNEVIPKNKDKERTRDLEKQCESMISKVYMLKERQLHIRSVIMSLLKTLDFRSTKKQTQNILSLLCELFEYSESQRQLIFAPKNRKFFGII